MRRGFSAFVGFLLLAGVSASPVLSTEWFENLSELADHFREQGLEPLPGHASMLLDGGVVGVFPGSPLENDEKPYVLVMASAPAGMDALGVFTGVGAKGMNYNDRPIPPLLASPGRHVIAAYWENAETAGEGVIPFEKIAAYIDLSAHNGTGGSLRILATASSPVWMRLIEQSSVPLDVDIKTVEAPDLGAAHVAAFYSREIPGVQLDEVHASHAPAGNGAGYLQASLFSAFLAAKVSRLDEPPPFHRVDRSSEAGMPKVKRPSTGTIPDYTADVEGLMLEGVVEGGPAEEAGLQAVDVIIELAGSAITDVYAYADTLDTLEIGVPITVVFLRDGERLETTLTPQGR